MLEDKLLVFKCKRGRQEAMRRIYQKYKDYLVTVAKALLNDAAAAEDVVHDVFVSFAETIQKFELRGSLRGYLSICVANLARDKMRLKEKRGQSLDSLGPIASASNDPIRQMITTEQLSRLRWAIGQLPYEQREAVVLHIKAGMKFRELAKLQSVSVNTVQGRYRYGLNKLRSLLNSEA
ncbi:MAG: RNA polymerase sigma factor [Planctomycetota bacterium]|jgi:RNA polymerase sigma-70 factor (ECF subfamily)